MRRLTARKSIYPSKNNKILTSLEFSRRCWTIVRRNSSWDIWIPLMRSSCSESAKNMQFPSPWLSDIAKPFSNAVVFNVCDSFVLLDSMRASSKICWSATKMVSPVNGRWKRQNKMEVISRQFNRVMMMMKNFYSARTIKYSKALNIKLQFKKFLKNYW